jgi:hypothetical protein
MCDAYLYLGSRDTITVVKNRSELKGTAYGRNCNVVTILFDKAPVSLPKADATQEQPAFRGIRRHLASSAIPKPRP